MPLLEKNYYAVKWFNSDSQFNQLYSTSIQSLAHRHWTPLVVARRAADYLASEEGVSILDIGSGVGKFCLAAAHYKPNAFYCGIEQRKKLVNHAESAKEILRIENASFINCNFTQIDFRKYDHFYFYNSFYENLTGTDKIDDSIDYSLELYNYYNRYLYKQLDQKPSGTKLATFHSLEDEIPQSYKMLGSDMNDLLKLWVKI